MLSFIYLFKAIAYKYIVYMEKLWIYKYIFCDNRLDF